MSALGKRMPVEVWTAFSKIEGTITTHHIHVRDELNDRRRSLLIFNEMEVAQLDNLCAPRLLSGEAWLAKDAILFAVPRKVKGVTSTLVQRSLQSRLGKNEHRVLIQVPPFRLVGNFHFVGRFQIQDALQRDQADFGLLTHAEVTLLPDPTVSFATQEVVFAMQHVKMFCAQFEIS